MIATLRPLTYQDLLEMPDDGQRHEIINGELVMTPAPNWNHQRVAGELYALLRDYLRATNTGTVVFAPFDVVLGTNDIVQPDLVVISTAQGRIPGTRNTFESAPHLVVEVISPSSRQSDFVKKMALYARAGVPEYWIADPEQRALIIHVLEGGIYRAQEPDASARLASLALPGLSIDPAMLFAILD
jgi:Uma2 family endonuclease